MVGEKTDAETNVPAAMPMRKPPPVETSLDRAGVAAILTLVLVVLAALFIYKWSGAFRTVEKVQSVGMFATPSEPIPTVGLAVLAASGARTINYLARVWPALLFGILIAGLVRAFVSVRDVTRMLGSGVVRPHLIAGAAGMPLMLCSCCIAPIFSSVRARGAPLGASLSLMFSSPSLNVAAIILTFMLFPSDVAFARVAMAAFAVFVLPIVIERAVGGSVYPKPLQEQNCEVEPFAAGAPFPMIGRWVTASAKVALATLPWILLGVFASCVLGSSLEPAATAGINQGLVIVLLAAFATLMALPTFFEIPLSMLLLQNGFPVAAVAAVLFAGPAINAPSLLTLARASSGKVALLVFLGIWMTATLGGLSLQFWRM